MRHVPDGLLRRLDDEPLLVPDRITDHLAGCGRCRARRAQIARDADRAAHLLYEPELLPDTDRAWARLERELREGPASGSLRPRRASGIAWRGARFPRVPLRTGLLIGAIGAVIAGSAAAATFTTIFAPTHVAPLSLSGGDLRAITAFTGPAAGGTLGGFATPGGSSTARFGTIRWSSAGPSRPVFSLAQATSEAGFRVPLPAHLPSGVGALQQLVVQPRVSATVNFNATAGSLAGSSVTLDVGPVVLAEYAGTNGTDVPTLGVATMPRPTASSTGASIGQLEAFLLAQPGIPAPLAEQIRLLGDLRTVLPVPVLSGASVRSVKVAGSPGILLADPSGAVAGVVWEDGRGMLHLVAGILDSQDVLNVARQLG